MFEHAKESDEKSGATKVAAAGGIGVVVGYLVGAAALPDSWWGGTPFAVLGALIACGLCQLYLRISHH
jgi:hypothetical protein